MSRRSGQQPSARSEAHSGKMDWRAFYRSERETPEAADKIDRWIGNASRKPDAALVDRIRRGAIVSFPHTTLETAGPLDARIIAALHAAGIRRIVCLGVLHSGCLAEGAQSAFRIALDPASDQAERRRALADIGGAFLPSSPASGPGNEEKQSPEHSAICDRSVVDSAVVRADQQGICRHEFSLDTFLTILSRYSERFPQFLPDVVPVYVGVTQCAERSFYASATSVADRLSKWITQDTALVATGDLIHYGPFYGVTVPGASGTDSIGAFHRLRTRLETLLARVLDAGQLDDESFEAARALGNDQRFIRPIVSALLGPHASAQIESFDMVDYSHILSAPAPCFVAAALAAYQPAPKDVDTNRRSLYAESN